MTASLRHAEPFNKLRTGLFQHPSIIRSAAPVARWALKRVQGDGEEEEAGFPPARE
jgi:hypothetical protein